MIFAARPLRWDSVRVAASPLIQAEGFTTAWCRDQPLVYPCRMNTSALDYRSLRISERIELVEDIWDSIAEETVVAIQLSAEERAELHRRLAAHLADPSSSIPWERVRATLFKGDS
ncbi:MAG: addiction module protein [Lysobacterales bacterium]